MGAADAEGGYNIIRIALTDHLQKVWQDYNHMDSWVQGVRGSSGMETQILIAGGLGYIENRKKRSAP